MSRILVAGIVPPLSPLYRLVLHGTAGAFAVRALAAVAGLSMNVLLARVLSVADYGVIALGLSWLTIIATAACFGTDTVSMRYVAQANAAADRGTIASVMKWGRGVTLSLGTLVGAASCGAAWTLFADYTRDQRLGLSLIVLAAPALALALNRASVLRGVKRVVHAAALETLLKPVTILVLVAATAWFAAWSPGVVSIAVVVVLGHVAMAGAGGCATRSLTVPGQKVSVAQRCEWRGVAKPIAFMSVAGVLIGNIDTVLVGYFLDAESAGIYRASAQVAGLVSFGLAASNGIVAPLIAELYGQDKRAELARVLRFSVALVSVIGVGGAAFMALFGQWALGHFGRAYTTGYDALLILLAAQAVNALSGPTSLMMSMTGHQSTAARIFAASAAISVVLNVLLIPVFGIAGAAVANLISVVVWNLILLLFLKRRLALDPSILAWTRSHVPVKT